MTTALCPACSAPVQATAIPGVGVVRCPTCGATVQPVTGEDEPAKLDPPAAMRIAAAHLANVDTVIECLHRARATSLSLPPYRGLSHLDQAMRAALGARTEAEHAVELAEYALRGALDRRG